VSADGRLRRSRAWLAGAAVAYRREWALVLGVALAIGVPSAAISLAADRIPAIDVTDSSAGAIAKAVLVLVGVAVGSLGGTVLAGALDAVMEDVAARHLGRGPRRPLLHVFANLPLGWLIVADLLVTAVTVVGLMLFLVPGLLAIPLLAMTGPLVTIERLRPLAAMRRSIALTRRAFGSVIIALVAPLMIVWVLDGLLSQEGLPTSVRVGGTLAVAILVAPYAALVKVLATHGLKSLEEARTA
jgi:hypothetical protein